jgi:hypothetical protein
MVAPEGPAATTYNRTRTNAPNPTQTLQSLANQPSEEQQTSEECYFPGGAHLPTIWQCSNHAIFETVMGRKEKLDDHEQKIFGKMKQL